MLVRLMTGACQRHPGLVSGDVYVGMPANPPKPRNLPELMAYRVAKELRRKFSPDLITKVRPTPEMKNLEISPHEKFELLAGAYEVNGMVRGLSVVEMDDLCRSGATIGTVAGALKQAGADRVLGIVATRTLRT